LEAGSLKKEVIEVIKNGLTIFSSF